MNPVNETELGREVRAAVAAALKRFGDNDIAAVKVSTLRKIDQLINPEPDTYRSSTDRCDARPYEALSQARVDRMHDTDAMRGML